LNIILEYDILFSTKHLSMIENKKKLKAFE